MKIVLTTEWFYPDVGGVASHVRDLALRLSEKKFEVFVLTKKKRGRNVKDFPFEVIEINSLIPVSNVVIPVKLNEIEKVLSSIKPDIVHAHHLFNPTSLSSLIVAHKCNIPNILTNHSAYFYDYDYLLRMIGFTIRPFKFVLKRVDKVIAVSEVAKKFIRTISPNCDIVVISNGVDCTRFTPHGPKSFRDNIGGDFVILYVGRIVPRKGLHILIQALSLIEREIPDIKLLVVGSGYGSYYMSILEMIHSYNLNDKVIFLGKVMESKLPEVYRSADVFVLPSLFGEAFGIVILEALASGVPVIASATGGVKEIIIDYVNGLLLKRVCAEEIAKLLLELFYDNNLRKKLAINGREFVLKYYDWSVVEPKILEVYDEVLINRTKSDSYYLASISEIRRPNQ